MDDQQELPAGVADTLREARRSRGITQADIARELGIGQRQISELERGLIDARLSTVQKVARALDLELMLVPRALVATVGGLVSARVSADEEALYALGKDTDVPPEWRQS